LLSILSLACKNDQPASCSLAASFASQTQNRKRTKVADMLNEKNENNMKWHNGKQI